MSKEFLSVCLWVCLLVVGDFTSLRGQSAIPQNNYLLVNQIDSLKVLREIQALKYTVDSLQKRGEAYLKHNQVKQAIIHFKNALSLQQDNPNPKSQIKLYGLLAQAEKVNQDFEQALEYTEHSHRIRTRLDSQAISQAKQTDQALKKEKRLAEAEEPLTSLDTQNKQWIWFLSFSFALAFILGVGLTFFFYKIFRRSQEMNRSLSKTIGEKTKSLLEVIHKLEEANKDLDTFLYKASHDLKGPLTTLDGLCNIGLMEIENESAREYLNMQKKVIHNLQLLLFRIVEIGNIRHHENHLRPVKIKKLCKQITRSMDRAEGFDNVSFVIDIHEEVMANTDIDMLEIALDNVFRNALQHANYQKHRPGVVTLRVMPDKEHLLIEIEDNGQGILSEIQPNIFDMFFRGTDFFRGFGLGLYKAKIAMHKIGGDIFLKHSEPGKTIFLIRIPKDMEMEKAHNSISSSQTVSVNP